MNAILAATDGSLGGDRAVQKAAELSHALNAPLTIVTVGQSYPSEALKKFARTESASMGDILEAECADILARARAGAERAQAYAVKTRAELGDPTQAILSVAKAVDAGMIVLGKRGRGQLEGLLLGSVSQKITSLAPCAVLVVP